MDAELRLYLAITRRLPAVKGAGVVANLLKRAYTRKPRPQVEVEAFGGRMVLEPNQAVDGQVLFAPQLYDRRQVRLLREHLPRGGRFVDVGANVGAYTLLGSGMVGAEGRVLAIEADPYNHEKLSRNLAASGRANVAAPLVGVSDKEETLRLVPGVDDNRGGSSFLWKGEGIEVRCRPLKDLLEEHGFDRVDALKMDIEGFEHRVFSAFLRDAPRSLWPRFVLVERHPQFIERGGGDVVALLESSGYRVAWRDEADHILVLPRDNL